MRRSRQFTAALAGLVSAILACAHGRDGRAQGPAMPAPAEKAAPSAPVAPEPPSALGLADLVVVDSPLRVVVLGGEVVVADVEVPYALGAEHGREEGST